MPRARGSAYTPQLGDVVSIYPAFRTENHIQLAGQVVGVIPAREVPDKELVAKLFAQELHLRSLGLKPRHSLPTRPSQYNRVVISKRTGTRVAVALSFDLWVEW